MGVKPRGTADVRCRVACLFTWVGIVSVSGLPTFPNAQLRATLGVWAVGFGLWAVGRPDGGWGQRRGLVEGYLAGTKTRQETARLSRMTSSNPLALTVDMRLLSTRTWSLHSPSPRHSVLHTPHIPSRARPLPPLAPSHYDSVLRHSSLAQPLTAALSGYPGLPESSPRVGAHERARLCEGAKAREVYDAVVDKFGRASPTAP